MFKRFFQKLHLLSLSGGSALNFLTVAMNRRSPDYMCINVGSAELIGPKNIVEQSELILDELREGSVQLYLALTADKHLIFFLFPRLNRGSIGSTYFYVGDEYLRWGDPGIRAYLVYIAFRVQLGLTKPSLLLDDYYNYNGAAVKNAALRTSQWLLEHEQPVELIKFFANLGSRS